MKCINRNEPECKTEKEKKKNEGVRWEDARSVNNELPSCRTGFEES